MLQCAFWLAHTDLLTNVWWKSRQRDVGEDHGEYHCDVYVLIIILSIPVFTCISMSWLVYWWLSVHQCLNEKDVHYASQTKQSWLGATDVAKFLLPHVHNINTYFRAFRSRLQKRWISYILQTSNNITIACTVILLYVKLVVSVVRTCIVVYKASPVCLQL